MKVSFIICMLLAMITISSCGDNTEDIEQYINDNAFKVDSINPSTTNFLDLEVLGKAIGDKQLVILGEQDHGDANTFLAKTRIIQYLHQRKGFNRILFEEDFSSLLLHDLNQLQNSNIKIANTLDDYWNKCSAFEPLKKYINTSFNSPSPMHFSGMDIYLDGLPSVELLGQELQKITAANTQANSQALFEQLIEFYTLSSKRNLKALGRVKIEELSKELEQITSKLDLNKNQQQIFKNVQAYMDSLLANYGATIRDQQMADNVLWYLKNHPEDKFIVWTANRHAAKNAWEMVTGDYGRRRSMGEHLVKQASDNLYTIGFISYSGNYGRIGQSLKTIDTPKTHSLGSWLYQKGHEYSFVDLQPFKRMFPAYDSMYYAKGMDHQIEKGQWHNIFDGLFYIKEMKSCLQK